MKNFIKNSLHFSLPFLAGIIVLFVLPQDKYFAYHFVKGECDNKADWMYHRIFEDPRPVDVVFSGASHTGSAIMDQFISEELSLKAGQEIEAVNYGYCRGGRDIQYVMLKDLFEQKHPRILVIDVAEDEPKKSHPVFPYLAECKDLFGSFVLFNQRYFTAIWKGITVRFESLRNKIAGGNPVTSENQYRDFGYRPSSHLVNEAAIKENAATWHRRLSSPKPQILRNIELNYSLHYLQKIARLAQENQCTLLFVYLPESGSNLKEPLLESYYEILAPVIILPESLILERTNWKDATHFNDSGAKAASRFLVPFLEDALKQIL
ncbi:hypothetical protein [Maribellus sediminis]|uniref:hypothetical protein n=1 Tax=Maribellus sediminis TaxID=2696285 RepID=UPI00142F991F|nr:hypothetical protein [Maribellus sediminis]